MGMYGFIGLLVAFVCSCLGAFFGVFATCSAKKGSAQANNLFYTARLCAIIAFLGLTLSCAVMLVAFFSGQTSIEYVVEYRSNSTSSLAWLYTLSGLWAGREGSLMFWTWLISCFNLYLVIRTRSQGVCLDMCALAIAELVVGVFVGMLVFSEDYMPFSATDASYFDTNGQLTDAAQSLQMNALLEHWAMAVHPPSLFIGYAGMTLPFSYALSTLIVGDDSLRWVRRVNGITVFAWLFIGIGIGLGAIWAYVVLGWGGYWGWDPVENASLLSWLCAVALIHSFMMYRKRAIFKRWCIVCACLTFMFVIVGTFISRSGIVESVHAFAGDSVSLVFFAVLIGASFLAALAGIFARRKSFAPAKDTDSDAFFSRETASYLNNLLMVFGAFVLAYLTLCSALPSWLPFGGQTISTGTYNAIARPLGILLFFVLALCPLLGWKKTDGVAFFKNMRFAAIAALVVFAALVGYFITTLYPAYVAAVSAATTDATELASEGPSWYYNGLCLVGFAVASLLVCNCVYMLIRFVRNVGKPARARLSFVGGIVAHAGVGVILIGLIGSSMYVSEVSGYLASDKSQEAQTTMTVGNYTLKALGDTISDEGSDGYRYEVTLEIDEGKTQVAQVTPAIVLDSSTMQQIQVAEVVSYFDHDLFVVYRGINDDGAYSIDVRINPLISFVWAGFVILIVGAVIACFARRIPKADGNSS